MREKKMFAQRTRTRNTDEAKRKYFLVYEGKETEEIYFESVSQNRSKIGIDPLLELVPVVRSYSEEGWSNPKKIVDRMLLNLEESRLGVVSYETLLNWFMDYLYEEEILTNRSHTLTKAFSAQVPFSIPSFTPSIIDGSCIIIA